MSHLGLTIASLLLLATFDSVPARLQLLSRRELQDKPAAHKGLYCKVTGGCSQCEEDEAIERYCADTGFKELLRCTRTEKEGWPIVLKYPYPPDVHISDDAGRDEAAGADEAQGVIRVVRSCTEKTVAQHASAVAAEVAGAGAHGAHGGAAGHTPLLGFELGMLAALGLSLPVVYWRKIRIRHL